MDTVSRATRSKIMAAVKSSRTRSTELRLRGCLMALGIHGWTTKGHKLPGKPDFIFHRPKCVIFVDGCFWHGCPQCYRRPKSNRSYWDKKIAANMLRDKKKCRELQEAGWNVLRFWEHDVARSPQKCAKIITEEMAERVNRR